MSESSKISEAAHTMGNCPGNVRKNRADLHDAIRKQKVNNMNAKISGAETGFMRRFLLSSCLVLTTCASAHAIPNLQVYCPEEGVYYDPATESWIIPYVDYQLWIIGAEREILDVKLAFAVPEHEDGTIKISRMINGVNDVLLLNELNPNSTPYDPAVYNGVAPFFVESGVPLMGDGGAVPRGGVFPSSYYQYYIGDFGLDTTVQNYIPGEEAGHTALGHIESLTISVQGYSTASIIAYDHVVLGNNKAKYVKTPYSHDGISVNAVPEPATLLLFGTGLAGLAAAARRKKTTRRDV